MRPRLFRVAVIAAAGCGLLAASWPRSPLPVRPLVLTVRMSGSPPGQARPQQW